MTRWRTASSTVSIIVSRFPACAPQAMFTDVISGISATSFPAPSPRSQLRSIRFIRGGPKARRVSVSSTDTDGSRKFLRHALAQQTKRPLLRGDQLPGVLQCNGNESDFITRTQLRHHRQID